MSEGIIAGCCGSIMLILFSTFLLVFIPRFTDEQTEKWRLPLPSIEGNRYEWCSVVDEDTVRFGGDEFKRVRTCLNIGESMWTITCSECGVEFYPAEVLTDSKNFLDGYDEAYCPICGAKVVEE